MKETAYIRKAAGMENNSSWGARGKEAKENDSGKVIETFKNDVDVTT